MERGQIVLQMQYLSQNRHGNNQRGDAAEDGARHKVGAEHGRMPHGNGSHGKVPRNYGVNGDGDGDDGDGHNVHRALEAMPLARRPAPTQRQHRVKLPPPSHCRVADQRPIRNDREEEEGGAARQIS